MSRPRPVTPVLSHARQALLEERARAFRFELTPTEAKLWARIRGRRLGVQFRRQVVLGEAIVDFFGAEVNLVVEVDGDAYHDRRAAADARRDEKLTRAGYRVVRIPASLIERDVEAAVGVVAVRLRE